MRGRFGELDEEVRGAIRRAEPAALEAVLTHISSDAPEQVYARLDPA